MTEVRHTDLALTREEAATLLSRWTAGPVTEALIDALHTRIEGWAAGLRLAAMTLEQGARPDEVLRIDDAAGTVLHELLITEALEQQPPDDRAFLQRTSILPVVEPASGEALSGRADSRDLLRRLAADHVFVTPLSDRTDHFRYHPLLADVLRLELRAPREARPTSTGLPQGGSSRRAGTRRPSTTHWPADSTSWRSI